MLVDADRPFQVRDGHLARDQLSERSEDDAREPEILLDRHADSGAEGQLLFDPLADGPHDDPEPPPFLVLRRLKFQRPPLALPLDLEQQRFPVRSANDLGDLLHGDDLGAVDARKYVADLDPGAGCRRPRD